MRKDGNKPSKKSPSRRYSKSSSKRKNLTTLTYPVRSPLRRRVSIWWLTAATVLIAIIVASVKLGYWGGKMEVTIKRNSQEVEELKKRIDEVERKNSRQVDCRDPNQMNNDNENEP